jgi:hypothetical protein
MDAGYRGKVSHGLSAKSRPPRLGFFVGNSGGHFYRVTCHLPVKRSGDQIDHLYIVVQ